MIGVLDLGPRVLAYSINGKIEKSDIERVVADMDAKVPLRIERVAVVADSNPIRTFANAQAQVARWFETRVFEGSQKAEAAAWVQT